MKLHRIDRDSSLWEAMRKSNISYILLNLTFPDNFPFAPPFVRVVNPVIEGGYVLDGGALCLELLTPNVSTVAALPDLSEYSRSFTRILSIREF